MSIKVKICGIRTIETAQIAVDYDADFLGFNFVPNSRRYIKPNFAAEIINKVKDKVQVIGVFQDEDLGKVNQIVKQLNLDFVQLHGRESSNYIKQIHSRVIKTVNSSHEAKSYSVEYLLLDRVKQGKGKIVDTDTARFIADKYPIFLAGGLTPQNVVDIVKKVRPFAVDVASGIESDGVEDIRKIREFIKNAKEALI